MAPQIPNLLDPIEVNVRIDVGIILQSQRPSKPDAEKYLITDSTHVQVIRAVQYDFSENRTILLFGRIARKKSKRTSRPTTYTEIWIEPYEINQLWSQCPFLPLYEQQGYGLLPYRWTLMLQ